MGVAEPSPSERLILAGRKRKMSCNKKFNVVYRHGLKNHVSDNCIINKIICYFLQELRYETLVFTRTKIKLSFGDGRVDEFLSLKWGTYRQINQ